MRFLIIYCSNSSSSPPPFWLVTFICCLFCGWLDYFNKAYFCPRQPHTNAQCSHWHYSSGGTALGTCSHSGMSFCRDPFWVSLCWPHPSVKPHLTAGAHHLSEWHICFRNRALSGGDGVVGSGLLDLLLPAWNLHPTNKLGQGLSEFWVYHNQGRPSVLRVGTG